MAKGDKKGKSGQQPVTLDPRFAQVYSDPRFKSQKRKDLRVKVDDRFSKEELGISKSTAKVDKYGRKLTEQKSNASDLFDKYYKTEEDDKDESDESDDEEKLEKTKDQSSSEEEDDEEEEEEEGEEAALSALDRARGIGADYSDLDTSDEDDDDSSDEEVVKESELEIEEEEDIEEADPTSTFACVNMDWDYITSTDLYATFSSFVPTGGKILSVSLYPSEYGKARMQQEEIEGPPRDLFKSSKPETNDSDDDSDDSDEEVDIEKATKELYQEDDGADFNSKELRSYQLQRLRYYYAIVKCDSVATSQKIYEACNGTEYESTANLFDLRYVPEDMTFDDKPRDQCSKVSAGYKPKEFITDALQHSKVKLTWDETPAERLNLATKAFSQKEIEDMDFKAYLASDSEDSADEDGEEMRNKYKSLASGSGKVGSFDIFGENDDGEGDIDMEITFTPGLSNSGKKAEEEVKDKDESTISTFQNKEKERRKKRKEKIKELKKEQMENKKLEKQELRKERSGKSAKKGGDKNSSKEDLKEKADLELLMMDETNKETQHFAMKDVLKAEKLKNKKKTSKKDKLKAADLNIDTDIKIDEGDDRFNEIFEDHAFAIDPTNTEFKKTEVMDKLLKSGLKKHSGKKSAKIDKKKRKVEEVEEKETVSDLVKKIKRKSGKK
ncbi:hypothetical protein CANARDRAFT_28669 [[Candida] arabinofermentans NRRL YB-2248]|uniref:Uncharacterized protein n=1 Tax=[Candida] arabinofermentans NRRL YB-2248 TaxID=983967 RepID=A0A1E4SZJ0_9ASCO|nr:hypothetical protein CANARDRAFT_28669 [[Candida] arabinofermentans NRRL YB-2248]